jgi:hypothetical protein
MTTIILRKPKKNKAQHITVQVLREANVSLEAINIFKTIFDADGRVKIYELLYRLNNGYFNNKQSDLIRASLALISIKYNTDMYKKYKEDD